MLGYSLEEDMHSVEQNSMLYDQEPSIDQKLRPASSREITPLLKRKSTSALSNMSFLSERKLATRKPFKPKSSVLAPAKDADISTDFIKKNKMLSLVKKRSTLVATRDADKDNLQRLKKKTISTAIQNSDLLEVQTPKTPRPKP